MVCPQGGLFLVGAFSRGRRAGGGGVGMIWSWFHSTIWCPWMEGPRGSERADFLGILPSLFSPARP